MVRHQFGAETSASTMMPGRCELQTGPQLEYRIDSDDEVEWIKMEGGDEPVQFEPPLVISAHHSHSLHTLHEKQNLRCWFEDMVDGRVAVDWESERVEISQFPAGFGFTIDSSFCSNPDVWWGEDYTFPKVSDGGDGDGSVTPRKDVVDTVVKSAAMLGDKLADEDETCCRPECGNPKLDNVSSCEEHTLQKDEEGYVPLAGEIERESVSEYDFDFWKSEWGKVYEDYEEKAVVVKAEGAPPAAIEAIETDVPASIMVEVNGWIAEGDGYCNAKWCTVDTPQRKYCGVEHGNSFGFDIARGDEKSNTDSKSLEDKLNEVADEIGQKRVEEMDERAVEYMRENRDVFKAEIVDASYSGHGTVDLKLDIPTLDGHSTHYLQLPDSDGEYSGDGRTREVMNYLGVGLRELHMVEGMYLPISFGGISGGKWTVQLPSDEKTTGVIEKVWNFPISSDGFSIAYATLAVLVSIGVAVLPDIQYTPIVSMFVVTLLVTAVVMTLPTWKDLKP